MQTNESTKSRNDHSVSGEDTSTDFVLVDNHFTAEEARKVLAGLIRSKISYHKNRKLQAFELPDVSDTSSEKRIEELENMRQKLLKTIKKAEENGKSMKVYSKIEIELESSDE